MNNCETYKKRKQIFVSQKIEILKALDSGKSIRKVAEDFQVSKGSVQDCKSKKMRF